MVTALAVLGVLLGLLLLLLAVPVAADFRLQGMATVQGQVTVRWLFGWVRLRHRWPADGTPTGPAVHDPEKRTEAKAAQRTQGRHVGALRLFRDAAFRRRVARLGRDLLEALHLDQLHFHARLGLGDPADTGRLWALMGPLNAVAHKLARIDVHVEPEFMDPVFEFDAHGACRLVPLRFLALAMAFMLSPATLRALHTARSRDG